MGSLQRDLPFFAPLTLNTLTLARKSWLVANVRTRPPAVCPKARRDRVGLGLVATIGAFRSVFGNIRLLSFVRILFHTHLHASKGCRVVKYHPPVILSGRQLRRISWDPRRCPTARLQVLLGFLRLEARQSAILFAQERRDAKPPLGITWGR